MGDDTPDGAPAALARAACAAADARAPGGAGGASTAWLDARACASVESFSGASLAAPAAALATPWLLLLFGDASPTRALTLATGAPLGVDVIAPAEAVRGGGGSGDGAPPAFLAPIREPRVRRRVWLRTGRGERVGYAVSWWAAPDLAAALPDEAAPIGGALAAARAETFRELLLVTRSAGGHADFDAAFAAPPGAPQRDLWARWYLLHARGRALCLVHEVFSPALEQWLGPMDAARAGGAPEASGAR